MTFDRRLTPFRPDLAADFLEGQVEAKRFAKGQIKRVNIAVTALHRAADESTMQETQLLFGEEFCVYDTQNGFCWGQSLMDSYVGFIKTAHLSDNLLQPTHRVKALRSFIYPKASIKDPPLMLLSMNSPVSVVSEEGDFAKLATGGFMFGAHLAKADAFETDPIAVATRFLHTPYLWGGRSSLGLDCSGLVQTALRACGIKALRDADMQEQTLGKALPLDLSALQCGDLIFWKGHVGLMCSPTDLLHANGHTMSVSIENIHQAVARIETRSYGKVTSIKRL